MDDQEYGDLESWAASILSTLAPGRDISPTNHEYLDDALQVSSICPSGMLLDRETFGSTAAEILDFASSEPLRVFCTDFLSFTWPTSPDRGEFEAL